MILRSWGWNTPAAAMVVRGIGLAGNFGTLIAVARWSSPDVLGIVIVLNGAAFFMGSVLSLGFPNLLLKTLPDFLIENDIGRAKAEYHRALRMVITVSLAAMVVAFSIATAQGAGFIPHKMGSMGRLEIISLAIGGCCMALQFLGLSVIRARREVAWSGVLQFCTPAFFLFLGFFLFATAGVAVSRVQGLVVFSSALIINTVLVLCFCRKLLGAKTNTDIKPIYWKEARSLWYLGLLSSGAANLPFLLASTLLKPDALALMGVPFRIANLPMTVVATLGAYYAPLIREAHVKHDWAGRRAHLIESQWIGVILVAPVLLLAVLCPEWILNLFQVGADDRAVDLFRIFAFAQLIIASCGVCSQYLAMLSLSARVNAWTMASIFAVSVCSSLSYGNGGIYAIGISWAIFSSCRQIAIRLSCPTRHIKFL